MSTLSAPASTTSVHNVAGGIHGMLFVASDVAAEHESDFNQWYDHEHVEERVRVPGFISGARYINQGPGRRYLGLYRTQGLSVFTTPAYQQAFTRQTPWSVANLQRMQDPMRRVCAVQAVSGQGSGSWLAVLPLGGDVVAGAGAVAGRIAQSAALGRELRALPGFVQSFLLVPDAGLSTPLPQEPTQQRQLQPLLVLETSSEAALQQALQQAATALAVEAVAASRYALGWKLTTAELA